MIKTTAIIAASLVLAVTAIRGCVAMTAVEQLEQRTARAERQSRTYASDRATMSEAWNEAAAIIDAIARDVDQCHSKAELLRYVLKMKFGEALPSIPEPWPLHRVSVERVRRVVGP